MYEVTYLQHSIFCDCKQITETVAKARLVELLKCGMITVLEARKAVTA